MLHGLGSFLPVGSTSRILPALRDSCATGLRSAHAKGGCSHPSGAERATHALPRNPQPSSSNPIAAIQLPATRTITRAHAARSGTTSEVARATRVKSGDDDTHQARERRPGLRHGRAVQSSRAQRPSSAASTVVPASGSRASAATSPPRSTKDAAVRTGLHATVAPPGRERRPGATRPGARRALAARARLRAVRPAAAKREQRARDPPASARSATSPS